MTLSLCTNQWKIGVQAWTAWLIAHMRLVTWPCEIAHIIVLLSRISNSLVGFRYPIKLIMWAYLNCTCNLQILHASSTCTCSKILHDTHMLSDTLCMLSVQCSTHFVNQVLFGNHLLTCFHPHTIWSNLIIIGLIQLEPWSIAFILIPITPRKVKFPEVLWIRKCQGQGKFPGEDGRVQCKFPDSTRNLHCTLPSSPGNLPYLWHFLILKTSGNFTFLGVNYKEHTILSIRIHLYTTHTHTIKSCPSSPTPCHEYEWKDEAASFIQLSSHFSHDQYNWLKYQP